MYSGVYSEYFFDQVWGDDLLRRAALDYLPFVHDCYTVAESCC